MEHSINLPLGNLLPCFFAECERKFRFLEQSHGYNYIAGLVECRGHNKVINPYSNQSLSDGFVALTRYERGAQAIEVSFDSDDYVLEGCVYYDAARRFEFSEILAAANKDDVGATYAWGLRDKDALSALIDIIAGAVRQHTNYFTNIDESFIKRANIIRSKRMEESIRQHFEAQMTYVCAEAKRALILGDYLQVVSLLEPLEAHLGAQDLRKLHSARHYVQP